MGIIEIIAAFLLIIACVFIVAVVLMQESKQNMSNVITGGSSDNYFQKNSGRTKEAKLAKATKAAAVIFFIVAIAVNLASIYLKNDSASSSGMSEPEISYSFVNDDGSTDGADIVEDDDDTLDFAENEE